MASSSPSYALDDPQQQRQRRDEKLPSLPPKEDECVVHKTKTIQFCGRTTPIVLQNDNGPCPLLAICNVLLLKNQLNLNLDTSEVSQEKLLSLVAERLIDSNSNVNNEDAGHVENQQQNIADAIDLLPRLTTGIDVNIKFRRIDDFEFTPECAIFDLLDIPLYHGWLVDPQDNETAASIGPKSYNTLMGELVALETRKLDKYADKSEEDCVDFAAATTATLGVPSPCFLRAKPFEDSLCRASKESKVQKGDTEEEAQLVSELMQSETEQSTKCSSSVTGGNPKETLTINCDGNMSRKTDIPAESAPTLDSDNDCKDSSKSGGLVVASTFHDITSIQGIVPECADSFSAPVLVAYDYNHPGGAQEGDVSIATDLSLKPTISPLVQGEMTPLIEKNSSPVPESDLVVSVLPTPVVDLQDRVQAQSEAKHFDLARRNPDFDSHSGQRHSIEAIGLFTSSPDGEPVYEGEECISESKATVNKDREPTYESKMVPAEEEDKVKDGEPVYEGEMALVEQANKGTRDVNSMGIIMSAQGEMINNFLKNTASQLTFYGLFCLQDGLKERELCVFFRNNHFNTMFKFEGELYVLATDLGYLNQPDLVWEKLNEVNGDTLFMTNKFMEFRLESQGGGKWDERSAVASTEDYFATMENATQENSDLQLAIALQQQEFEQQPQRHAPQGPQQPLHTDRSRLIIGPHQPARSSVKPSSASTTQDPKSKEKCTIM